MERNDEIFDLYLSKDAAGRFMRINSIDKDRAQKIKSEILSRINSGKISSQISEKDFLNIASKLEKSDVREINIARRKSYLDF